MQEGDETSLPSLQACAFISRPSTADPVERRVIDRPEVLRESRAVADAPQPEALGEPLGDSKTRFVANFVAAENARLAQENAALWEMLRLMKGSGRGPAAACVSGPSRGSGRRPERKEKRVRFEL